jgi:hypothetical protein
MIDLKNDYFTHTINKIEIDSNFSTSLADLLTTILAFLILMVGQGMLNIKSSGTNLANDTYTIMFDAESGRYNGVVNIVNSIVKKQKPVRIESCLGSIKHNKVIVKITESIVALSSYKIPVKLKFIGSRCEDYLNIVVEDG